MYYCCIYILEFDVWVYSCFPSCYELIVGDVTTAAQTEYTDCRGRQWEGHGRLCSKVSMLNYVTETEAQLKLPVINFLLLSAIIVVSMLAFLLALSLPSVRPCL